MTSESYVSTFARFRAGDQQAFDEWVVAVYPELYRLAWRFFSGQSTGSTLHDLAEEIAQKTCIAVYQRHHQLKDLKKFRAWVFRIATNFCLDESRKKNRRRQVSLSQTQDLSEANATIGQLPSPGSGPHRQLEQQEVSQHVVQALSQLPREQRLVLILKEYQGLKFREIAETLAISENTAKSRLYYGLKSMRKALEAKQLTPETLHYE